MPQAIRDDQGRPWSKWAPTQKFEYILSRDYPGLWDQCDPEHQFCKDRRWRLDYSWPALMIGVEIHGQGGYHNSAAGMAKDLEKANWATEDGWRVLFYSTPMISSMAKCEAAVEQVARLICEVGCYEEEF